MKRLVDIATSLVLPLRNLWRNRRRAAITLASIIVGTLALLYLGSYVSTMDMGLKGNAINKEVGHFQIARTGYFDDAANSSQFLIDPVLARRIEAKLASMTTVQSFMKRLYLVGMISAGKSSAVFSAVGDETETLHEMYPSVIDGEPLSADAPDGILIGRAMAKQLNVQRGATVLLTLSSESGDKRTATATVRGIYKGLLKEQEQSVIFMPIDAAGSLAPERNVHKFICFADSMGHVDAAIADIKAFVRAEGLDLEVRRWDELAVMYRQIIGMFTGIVVAAAGLIFIVIIFGISNTMFMTVTERTAEIGTLRAIGESRMAIVGSFFLEGLFLGIIGALVGILIASLSTPIINSLGLTLPPGPGQDERIPIVLTPTLNLALATCAVNIVAAALASLPPSIRAVRRTIAAALRFV